MEEEKLSPFSDDIILYIQNPKEFPKKKKKIRTKKWVQRGDRI